MQLPDKEFNEMLKRGKGLDFPEEMKRGDEPYGKVFCGECKSFIPDLELCLNKKCSPFKDTPKKRQCYNVGNYKIMNGVNKCFFFEKKEEKVGKEGEWEKKPDNPLVICVVAVIIGIIVGLITYGIVGWLGR